MSRRRFNILLTLFLVAAVIVSAFLLVYYGMDKVLRARYPLKYESIILAAAEENNLPQSFLFAVVNTESSFKPEAVSNIGASGLMQITEDTFDWIQSKMGLEEQLSYSKSIFDPKVNVTFGSYLLKYLYDEFGSYELALCAYHAGRGSVNSWLADEEFSDDGKTLRHIPFKDTRWYVERVSKTTEIYQGLYELQ